jgi:hypothetical protein
VAAFVSAERAREERIERIVGIAATVLVLGLFAATAGLGLLEGVAAYAVAGALVWLLSKGSVPSR